MSQLITYRPQAPAGQFNPASTGRIQAMRLQTPVQDTITPQIIARAGSQIGNALMEYGKEQRREEAVALALETMQEAEKEYSAFENDYMTNKRRKDAATAPDDFSNFMSQSGTKFAEKLKDNSLALSLFNKEWGRRSIDAVRTGGAYARREDEAWRGEIAEGEAATLMQRAASIDDPAAVGNLLAEHVAKVSELLPGRDMTAYKAKIGQDLTVNMIGRSLAAEQFGQARTLAEQNRALLGNRYDDVMQNIKSSQRSAASYYEGQAEKSRRKDAITTAVGLVTRFGGDSKSAIEEINTTAKDPEQRLLLTSAYLNQRNIDDAAQAQIKQEQYISTQKGITEDITAAGKDVMKLNEIIANAPPEHKQFALAHVEQAVGKQRRSISDPEAWAEAHTAITRGAAFEVVMGQYAGKISDQDSQNFKDLADNRALREAEAKDNLYFESLFARSRFSKLDSSERGIAKAQLKQEYFERTRGIPDLRKRQDIAFELLHDRDVPGKIFGAHSPNTVNAIKAREYEPGDVRYTVPRDARKRITESAAKKGIALSEDEIEAAYIHNRRKLGY